MTRKLQNWVSQNGFEDISIVCDNEWYYDHAKTEVAYTMSKDPIVEETFKAYCRNCGLLDDFDPFILSFSTNLGIMKLLILSKMMNMKMITSARSLSI